MISKNDELYVELSDSFKEIDNCLKSINELFSSVYDSMEGLGIKETSFGSLDVENSTDRL